MFLSANSDELDEKGKPPVVQRKGRFKVTSESVDLEKVTYFLVMMFTFVSAWLEFILSFQVASSPVMQKSQSMQVRSSEVSTYLQRPDSYCMLYFHSFSTGI